jgi:hypothetical protein
MPCGCWALSSILDATSPHKPPISRSERSGPAILLEQLTKEQAADLATIAPHIKNPGIRAIVADAAWLRGRGNPDLARVAVAAYLASARNLEDPEKWSDGMARAERALGSAARSGRTRPLFCPPSSICSNCLTDIEAKTLVFSQARSSSYCLSFASEIPPII